MLPRLNCALLLQLCISRGNIAQANSVPFDRRWDVGWTHGRGGRSAGALNSASQAALLTQKIQSLSPPSGALSAALHPAPGDGQPNGALGNDSFYN